MSSRYGDFNRALMEDLRANEGRATSGPFKGKDVLILHTKGAKSGEEREAVLGYLPDNGHYILIASKGALRRILPGITTWSQTRRRRSRCSVRRSG